MSPDETYYLLAADRPDAFEVHVMASILALALSEAAMRNTSVSETAGYTGAPTVLTGMFPHARELVTGAPDLVRTDDEACLLDLFWRGASTGSPFEALLAGMLARRSQRPNHLWQDLGLRNRGELSRLMTRWFAPLARRNTSDMKWKKFFFRTICRDTDYTLCTAPSCGECCDFDKCFDEETGESFLAHLRHRAETATN